MPGKRLGIVLFQLGGPDTLKAIEPFLYNLFCDPDIIDFPFAKLGRKPLAKLISVARAKKVEHHYSVIGGGSPIRRHTERQARALESVLRERGLDAHCFVAMRYWHPFTAEAVERIKVAGCDELILLPLYPHFSSTTTGSSLNEWERRWDGNLPTATVRDFYRNETYLSALVEKVEECLSRFGKGAQPHLIFSAHSLPVAVVEKGDPYRRQIEETVALLMERGAWSNPHVLCYQSKVGASKWLQPSLRSTIRELGARGVRQVCVVPVSFVSDHVETLGEIDHEARELAEAAGIDRFEMTEGLNDSPRFIEALAELVMGARQGADDIEVEGLIAAD